MPYITIFHGTSRGPGLGHACLFETKEEAINSIINELCSEGFKYRIPIEFKDEIIRSLEKLGYYEEGNVMYELYPV